MDMEDEDITNEETNTGKQYTNSTHDILEGEKIKRKAEWLAPYQFKPGTSGNISGRPKGTVSLKTYVKNMLMDMDPDEKLEFLKGLNKAEIWKMGEGNPETKTDIKVSGTYDFTPEELEEAKKLLSERISQKQIE